MFSAFDRLRKVYRLALLILITGALSACQLALPGIGGGGPNTPRGTPVEVALLLPYGSPNSGDEIVARSLENSARLAAAEMQGVTLNITVYNTAANPATAATVARQAIAAGSQVIVGPLRSDAAAAVGVAVAGSDIAVLSFSNNAEIAGGNVFVLGNTFQNTANRVVGYAASQGANRLMVLHPQNLSGEVARGAVEQAAANNGSQIAGVQSYPFSQQGVVQAVSQVVRQIRATDANGLFFTSDASAALPLFAQLLPEAGLDTTRVQTMGLARWDIPAQTLELSGLQGGWFALPDPAATSAFNARYAAAYGDNPHVLGAIGYDAMRAVGETAGSRGALGPSELTASNGFAGAGGTFRLRPDGTNQRALAVAQVSNRQVVIIDPAPTRLGAAGF